MLFHLSHFPFKIKKMRHEHLTETRHLEVSKTPEIPLKIWVPDRGCEPSFSARDFSRVFMLKSK